jgi:hypothetical protein
MTFVGVRTGNHIVRHPIHGVFMRCVSVLAVIALCGCASSGAPSSHTQTISVEGAGSLHINSNSAAVTKAVPFPIDRAWRVMPGVFDSLGIPITRLDAANHTIANEGAKTRIKLKSTALSTYIDCGASQIGPNADSYDVFYTVTTQITSTGPNAATVSTLLEASARPLSFAQEYSRCSSKGVLEARIADLVRAKLQG